MSDAFVQHGVCSWIELYTSNKAQTKTFYTQLFGWAINDMEMADGSVYSVINIGEQGIGGIVEHKGLSLGSGGWGIYITVDSVDETADTVLDIGGKVLMAPFDVLGVGRMAKIADPSGAALSIITYAKQ